MLAAAFHLKNVLRKKKHFVKLSFQEIFVLNIKDWYNIHFFRFSFNKGSKSVLPISPMFFFACLMWFFNKWRFMRKWVCFVFNLMSPKLDFSFNLKLQNQLHIKTNPSSFSFILVGNVLNVSNSSRLYFIYKHNHFFKRNISVSDGLESFL